MRLFGRLLAEDLEAVGKTATPATVKMWTVQARKLSHALDEMEVVGTDEQHDREIEELAQGEGRVWLELAEDGTLDETDFVAHVLFHFNAGGKPAPPWVAHLLHAIGAAPEHLRHAFAGAFPEYAGLMRAATEVPEGLARLVAVLDRR